MTKKWSKEKINQSDSFCIQSDSVSLLNSIDKFVKCREINELEYNEKIFGIMKK